MTQLAPDQTDTDHVTFHLKLDGENRVFHVPRETLAEWHEAFLQELPRITEHAKVKFGYLQRRDPQKFEEKVHITEETAWEAYLRERLRGTKDPHTFISSIAEMAARHTKARRDVSGQERIRDVTSARCQTRNGFCVQTLPEHDSDEGPNQALDALIDHRTGDPGELAAFTIDTPVFRDGLTSTQQQVMDGAIIGDTTTEMATRLKVTPGAISQHRRKIAEKYLARDEDEGPSR